LAKLAAAAWWRALSFLVLLEYAGVYWLDIG
jgi:hypothetical protein